MHAEVLTESPKLWQALLYAAIAISILITSAAERVAARDAQQELQSVQRKVKPPDSS
jgi:hypothetical protein